jgi:FtsZ-binding cell division protein ZapB
MTDNNIWYLPGPFHRYEGDVKAIAKKHGLRIVDANVTESRDGECEKAPKVALKELPAPLVVAVVGDDKSVMEELIGKLQAESDAIRVLVDGLDSGEILKPEAGELAIRLFDSLDHIRLKVDELAESRDQIAQERNALQVEVEALKKAETERVEKTAKPKPDAKQPADKAAQTGE